jgi:hypothetical protein
VKITAYIPFFAALSLVCDATESPRPWTEYQTILWMGRQAEQRPEQWPLIAQRMRELNVNAASVGGGASPRRLLDAGFGYYVENVVNRGLCLKFNSRVTDWNAHIKGWMQSRDEAALVRDYCFDDPQWLGAMTKLVGETAARHAAFRPLACDLRDELSVTISANPFDYDFAPAALAAFRVWLRERYADLAALNAQWDTDFAGWEEVRPFTTDRMKARMATGARMPAVPPDWGAVRRVRFDPTEAARDPSHWNFSPWCDHRTYMDVSLARTLAAFRAAARERDPVTPVGIEGTQMPHAFGGYDLERLSQVLDWVEPYDVGNAREIFGSFMPGRPMLATFSDRETNPALRRLWHLLLLGDRGCIVWWSEDCLDWTKPDLPLTPKGVALAPALGAMRTPLARLFLLARREHDPIAIHYSQPSIQVAWLLESTSDGATWPRRFSSFEATHNRHAQLRNSWLKILQDLGYSPRFLGTGQIEHGALAAGGWRVVVLPGSFALTPGETAAFSAFARPPQRVLLGDRDTGSFDGHGKLSRTARPSGVRELDLGSYGVERLKVNPATANIQAQVAARLADAGLAAAVRVPASARVRTHRFTIGGARLLAFERGVEYRSGEDLRPAGGNRELEQPVTFEAAWDEPREAVNLRTGERLGRVTRLTVTLDPWQPALFALLDAPVAGDVVATLSKPAVSLAP